MSRADYDHHGEIAIDRDPGTPPAKPGEALELKQRLLCKCGHGTNAHGRNYSKCLSCECEAFEVPS